MNLGYVYHAIGTAVCIAISYGVNAVQRPAYDPGYPAQVYSEERGTLQLNYHGQTLSYPLMLAEVSALDVKRIGREYQLRELTLRAAGARDQKAKLELYIDLSRSSGVRPGAGDPQAFAQQELPVAPSGRFGTRASYVVLDDGKAHDVVSGNFMLTEVASTEADKPPRYNAAGRVELQLEGAAGVELITGRFEGQLAWDAAAP